jgi:hypothetical protein
MSVNNWDNGTWVCNYGSIARSKDLRRWELLPLRWPGDSRFCQMVPVEHDGWVYVVGISGGRLGPARLMRVRPDDYENFDAYEYLTGREPDGTPIYTRGEEGLRSTYELLPGTVGEPSILYSEYLGEWIITYISPSSSHDIILRTAKTLDGVWSEPVSIVPAAQVPGLYGAFMNPRYVSADGKRIRFLMSLWLPVYNVSVMEMELERKDDC